MLAKERTIEAYEAIGANPYHYSVLAVLEESARDTQAKIADALGYDRSWLVGLLDELEEAGLIERKRDPDDRRRHLVSLNPAGKKRLAQLRAISKKVEDDLLASLDAEQRAQLHVLLAQLAADHDPRYAPGNGQRRRRSGRQILVHSSRGHTPATCATGSRSSSAKASSFASARRSTRKLEMTEIVDRTVRAGGPALLFENPKGAQHPLLINQFGTEKRMCLAFGVESLDDIATKLGDILEMQPPEGLAAKVRGLKTLKSIADSRPRTVKRGASQEIVLRGDDVDLGRLPVQTCWPGDAGPFITLPAVITRDPRTGQRNVGMYRMQVLGPRSTAMHWQIHKDGRADYLFTEGRMEVAVALGLDPISAYSASAPLPKHIDEFMMAGFLRGEPLELVKGVTVDLEVPADAEIVLEGYIDKGELDGRRPVRRSHGLLHAGRAVSRLQRHGDHDAQGRDLSRRSSSASRRRRTRGSARRPSGSSCPP